MNAFLWVHIAAGMMALFAGASAVVARKGGRIHAAAGMAFAVSMVVLGVSATVIAQLQGEGDAVGGLVVCYFVATAWVAARRRDGSTGRFEIAACAVALGAAALMAWGAATSTEELTPVGPGPVFALAGVCLLAGLTDLKAILTRRMTAAQRLSRHLWRMCFAFFIATGSFFLGQQQVLPEAVRGSPVLFVLAFAPFAVMAIWLVRIRLGKKLRSRFEALRERPRATRPAVGRADDGLAKELAG